MNVREEEILSALRGLDPRRWVDVLAYIGRLGSERTAPDQSGFLEELPILRAEDLLGSDLVGMWVDRTDIEDSLTFARRLRSEAEHRKRGQHAAD